MRISCIQFQHTSNVSDMLLKLAYALWFFNNDSYIYDVDDKRWQAGCHALRGVTGVSFH